MHARAIEGAHPPRGLEPEGDGRGVLKPRASGHHRCHVPLGQRGGGIARAPEGCEHDRERVAQLEHPPAVDDILARGAPMHVARGIRIDARNVLRELPHERDREIAREHGAIAERGEI